MIQKNITINTPENKVLINTYIDTIDCSNLEINKELFTKKCLESCRNFKQKYSCPPLSPTFHNYIKEKTLLVLLLKINLDQFSKYKPFHRIKIANSILKSRADKIMRQMEKHTNTKFISNGSCRLCKPCQKKLNKPCKHPKEMRFSLESLGINCNNLSTTLFNLPLLWYGNKTCPEYTLVITAIPLNDNLEKYKLLLSKGLNNLK